MTISRSSLGVCRKIGIEFRLYDLRHTFGSRAAMAGVDLPTLKELMGHSSITLTMRYVHPTPAHKVEALNKLRDFNSHKSGHAEKFEAVS
jgi:integrase